jgi:hypothetical protein
MSVKNFKFVSPGVFINEIDNSFIPKSADQIGPVVIGRSRRGMAMQPVKVESYSEFVQVFGETVPGNGGGDIYRNGNYQSPMYGTYAAKAFLRSNVAPLTYIRLLGQQDANATSDGYAGWETNKDPAGTIAANGGAYGLWVWPSSSNIQNVGGVSPATVPGVLAAVWYVNKEAQMVLSGTVQGGSMVTGGVGWVIGNDTSNANCFTVQVTTATGGPPSGDKIRFNFDDSSDLFIRKRFNTNPQLVSTQGQFYPSASYKPYWLGETFEQEVRDGLHNQGTFTATGEYSSLTSAALHGVILPLALNTDATKGPHNVSNKASQEGKAGWFIGQDLGLPGAFSPQGMQKLFRLKGRGHGEWLQKNVKVSIEKIRKSTTTTSDYGTFSVILRALSDTDNNVQVMERFDNCTLDPTSPNFLSRKLGDQYTAWDSTSRRLKTYGEYPNQSKFVYVDMNADVEAGATDAELLPFGYFGPPRPKNLMSVSSSADLVTNSGTPFFVYNPESVVAGATGGDVAPDGGGGLLHNSVGTGGAVSVLTGSLAWPSPRLRLSASDGGLADPTNACFGLQTTRTNASTANDHSVADALRLWTADQVDDPTATAVSGFESYAYVFSLDDVMKDTNTAVYNYRSGSRASGLSVSSASYGDLLSAGYNRFTAPFFGGFDGFNITRPDPLFNKGMSTTSTEINSSPYHTYRRAIDTVADPESLNMNLLVTPGLTNDALTNHMVNVCEDRGDAMALIDLADVYIPPSEQYYSNKASRIGSTPTQAANALRDRRIDSSYGATFYPWVQTRDESTGANVWLPPSVAMLGVLASSQASSEVWFAPAGFNRGGLSEGAAGIPISAVTEKLTSKERDTLYDARINPIASFPSSGIVVFGQKTLQERQSALDRINVRRLVIYLKKQISILSTQVLFEQNVQATWNRFKGLINPFLANVLTGYGITEYRLILDESTTTPDLIDQNIMYAKIMVKPARSIEYIAIDFVIASTGASFDD